MVDFAARRFRFKFGCLLSVWRVCDGCCCTFWDVANFMEPVLIQTVMAAELIDGGQKENKVVSLLLACLRGGCLCGFAVGLLAVVSCGCVCFAVVFVVGVVLSQYL